MVLYNIVLGWRLVSYNKRRKPWGPPASCSPFSSIAKRIAWSRQKERLVHLAGLMVEYSVPFTAISLIIFWFLLFVEQDVNFGHSDSFGRWKRRTL